MYTIAPHAQRAAQEWAEQLSTTEVHPSHWPQPSQNKQPPHTGPEHTAPHSAHTHLTHTGTHGHKCHTHHAHVVCDIHVRVCHVRMSTRTPTKADTSAAPEEFNTRPPGRASQSQEAAALTPSWAGAPASSTRHVHISATQQSHRRAVLPGPLQSLHPSGLCLPGCDNHRPFSQQPHHVLSRAGQPCGSGHQEIAPSGLQTVAGYSL